MNGTLFYCFEYFLFLKQYININFILINTSDEDLEMFISIFKEKYNFNHKYLDDIIVCNKRTDLIKMKIQNLMALDINTYKIVKNFTLGIKSVRVYSNEPHNFVSEKPNHKFYGFYDYQPFDTKERLKLYGSIHKVFDSGDKTFLSALNDDYIEILRKLNIDKSEVYVKAMNTHNNKLFELTNKMIYWHSGNRDTNNRFIVESYIHNIPLTVHLNGYTNDSVQERFNLVSAGRGNEFMLDIDDLLIQDFLNDCKN